LTDEFSGFDPGALAAEWNALGSAPAPTQDTAQPEPPATEGSTPPAEAAPAPVSEGTTPPAQPPATAVEDQDLAFALEKAGIEANDPQALSKLAKYLRSENNRMGEMGRELQELKKAPVAPPPVVAPPVQAHPAQPEQTQEQYVQSLVQQDREYQFIVQDFQQLSTEAQTLATFDHLGRVNGGRIAELNKTIANLSAYLQGPEALKGLGLQAPELDTFQQQEIRARLSVLNAEKAEARIRFREIQGQQKELERQAQGRYKHYTDQIESQRAGREQAEQEEREVNTEADKFKTEWSNTFKSLATAKQVPEAMLKTLWSRLVRSAKAHDGAISELNPWMAAEIEAELKTLDEYHRFRSGQHATAKRADVQQASQPANAAAVAPPAPGKSGDWEADLLATRQHVYGQPR